MKKVLSTVFFMCLAIDANALTFSCTKPGLCQPKDEIVSITKCKDITKNYFDKNDYLHIPSSLWDSCKKQRDALFDTIEAGEHTNCSLINVITFPNKDNSENTDNIYYCYGNQNIQIEFTAPQQTDSWSYAQKRCVGSGGEWTNNKCDCKKLTGTTDVNNECICTQNKNQKYYNKILTGCEQLKDGAINVMNGGKIYGFYSKLEDQDKQNSCSITGGSWVQKDNSCFCNSDLGLELDNNKYFCNCKTGMDYTDPLKKAFGCISISDIPGYDMLSETSEKKEPEDEATGIESGTDTKGDENTDIDDASGDDDNETQNENENPEISDKLKSAQDALAAAREKENSWANRAVTAASSAMTGLGGMQLAEGIAEQRADAEAEKEMRAYIETMKCEYGNGQNVKLGNEEITLPGGNELLDYYTEYKQLADNLKTTKSALGLRSGIESEVLYDRAQSGLYQYASIGKTGGAETSLYRALTDKESADAASWAEQKEKSAKQLKTGALVAGAGVATGIIGNYLVNERGNKTE